MPDIENPLDDDALLQINEALDQADAGERAITKATRAGIELPGQLELLREQRERLQAIKRTYFPGQ